MVCVATIYTRNQAIQKQNTGCETFVTNIIISIYSELSQERRILSERIRSGLVNAIHKGQRIGKPKGMKDDQALLKKYPRLVADLKKGLSLSQCQKIHDVSRNTAIKVRRLWIKN